jgi:hypothetical protein
MRRSGARAVPAGVAAPAGVLAALLALAAGPVAAGDPCPPRLEETLAENARLRARIAELESELAGLRAEKRDLQIVAGIAPADAGERAERAVRERLTTSAAGGTTTVTTPPLRLDVTHGTAARHWVRFRAAGASDAVLMVVSTRASGGIYRGVPHAVIDVDGASIACAVVGYDSRRVTAGTARAPVRRDDETVTLRLPPAAIERLAAARQARGRLGPVRFTLSDPQLAAVRVVRTALAPRR